MTKYHAELLKGPMGDAAKELADVCLAEFDRWAEHEPTQAAGVTGGVYETGRKAAETALYDVRTLLDDYLAAELAVVLTSWGLGPDDRENGRMTGVKVYRCRWCGRRVTGIFGWFHKPARCNQKPDKRELAA